METTGNMKSVAEIIKIIEDKYTYIPLLQRNYKWTMECASELAEDLWDYFLCKKEKTYQLNMITIYKNNEDNSLQILDGQQRLITLKLFLAFLERESVNINFAFERDFKINERKGRRYFIDYYLKKNDTFQNDMEMSVDIKRLYENFTSMIIPVSFRSIYMFYRECLDEAISLSKTAEELFVAKLMEKLESFLKNIIAKDKFDKVKECIMLDEKERESVYKLCQNFNGMFAKADNDEMSNDEIRISEYSNQYQEIWQKKIHKVIREVGIDNIISTNTKEGLATYIKKKVEMLYHETSSEPIDEFLNINENKTRFVISDYIRANMISDNPIDGNIGEEMKNSHQKNRTETLRLFSSLSNYLYNTKYQTMWELIKQRYDDFEKQTDINRLKVLFCDKYAGTSTKGYSFETELKRLQYFEMMLQSLSNEIVLEDKQKQKVWSTYNAIYMLLECKKKYRFFSLFTQNDIDKTNELKDVAVREKFCFFEWAYKLSQSSEDFWDISYLLESQLYVEKCNIKKSKHLPKNQNEEWCYINRGTENDELNECINQFIESIKEQSYNE